MESQRGYSVVVARRMDIFSINATIAKNRDYATLSCPTVVCGSKRRSERVSGDITKTDIAEDMAPETLENLRNLLASSNRNM